MLPDMTRRRITKQYREKVALEEARRLGQDAHEGVYAWVIRLSCDQTLPRSEHFVQWEQTSWACRWGEAIVGGTWDENSGDPCVANLAAVCFK